MPYLFNTPEDQHAMLAAIGVDSIEALFEQVPAEFRLDRALDIPSGLTEIELTGEMERLAAANAHAGDQICFLGGGAYDHFIPAVVDSLASRGEFYTSYTPYQPEVSQGNLQVMFEYQTLVCQLTGMDVSNASLYDGGTAAVEAVLMCLSALPKRRKVVVLESVHPEYRQILETYLVNLDAELVTLPAADGVGSLDQIEAAVDDQTACVLVQTPNFFGCLEDVAAVAELAHAQGSFLIASVDPISLGLLKRPGDCGADIVVAEGQGLGSPLAYGGPYLGILACRESFVRRMPGRIAGETVDRREQRCWVLTLQTREQHIRREKATSNICTNQGLLALRASIYLAALGPHGMREVAELCLHKAHYACDQLTKSDRWSRQFTAPFFKEFVVRDEGGDLGEALDEARQAGILAGVPLGTWYPELDDCLLVAVTERRTQAEIESLAAALAGAADPAVQTA